jgi:hypothetical protein
MPETPLETARRLWPGAWLEQPNGDLQRVLFCAPIGIEYIQIRKPWSTGMKDWIAYYNGSSNPTIGIGIGQGPIEDTILQARDRVQSMARDFARAAGVEVVGG